MNFAHIAYTILAATVAVLLSLLTFYYTRHRLEIKKHLTERNIEYIMERMCLDRQEAIHYLRNQPLAAKNHRLLTRKVFISKLPPFEQQHPLVKAYLDDADIEVRLRGTDIWRTHPFPTFDTRFCDFRIKQE